MSTLNLCTMVILDRQGMSSPYHRDRQNIAVRESGGSGGQKQAYLTGREGFFRGPGQFDMQMDNPLSGHRAALIITAGAANDLAEYLFRLRENQAYRQKVNIAIAQEDPRALMGFENEGDQPMGFVIDDTIHTGKSLAIPAPSPRKNISTIFWQKGLSCSAYRPCGQAAEADGYSVFRDAKLVGFIPMESSRG